MLKIIKLSCLAGLFFAGGLYTPINAQEVKDSTAAASPTINKKIIGLLVKGAVKSAKTKTPLAAINITVEGFSAAISNDDGSFEIRVPNLEALLKISAEHFQTKVYALRGKESGITIYMSEDNYSSTYEAADLAAGDKLLYNSTHASNVVNFSKDQWSNPINESVGGFLQGKVAGLNTVRNSGTPGAGTYLTLRGFNSLYATNKPLIIVDGMIYDDEDYGSGIIQNNISSPLANIDVKDIEDVTVIKDGSSLYGTKGANGVIKITTIRPTELSTKIDFTMYGEANQTPDHLPVLDANGYRTYLSQLESSRGLSQQQIAGLPYMNDEVGSVGYYKYHNNTNWQDQVFKPSMSQNYFLKVRGGDDIAKFGLSVGYLDSKGIVDQSNTRRYSTRLNAALRLTEKLSLDANLSFINNEQDQWDQGFAYKTSPMYLALTKSPFLATNEVSDAGEVSPNLADVDYFNVGNPSAILANGFGVNKNYRFFGNLNFKYAISKAWDINTIVGLTLNKEREAFFIPDFGVADIVLPTAIGKNRSGSEIQKYSSLYTDTFANYLKTFHDEHNLDVRFGARTQKNTSESDLGLGFNSATDDFTTVGSGSNLLRQVGGALGEWNWINVYANANYNFRNKYYLTTSYAVDGSSRFGDKSNGNDKYALMTSLSAAWLVSSESFMKDVKGIDYLKLRASYGYSGNDDIGNFTAQKYYVSQNLLGMQGLVRGNIGNPNLQWETVKKLNLGTDFGLFNERLNGTIDVYYNKTRNMIVYEPITNTSGFEYVTTNSGAMRTLGAEIGLKARVVNAKDLTFDLGVNLSHYKNRVEALPTDNIYTQFAGATYVTTQGKNANSFFGLKSNGVYSTTAEASAAGLSRVINGVLVPFGAGDVKFEDKDGNKIIDTNDRMVIGNPNPTISGSFSTNIEYKRLSLQALFNFSVGNDIYNGLRYNLEKMSGYENQSIAVGNRWRAEGQQTDIPRATWGDTMGNSDFSSRWIEDGSYLRLKSLVLGYDLKIKNTNYIKSIKLYATANNLVTFTKYLGYDPEFSATSSIFGQGTDIGLAPQFASYQLGLRLGL